MIDILNGWSFKRNHENVILFSVAHLSSVTGLQPYVLKEHYFGCVKDDAFAEGEFHTEIIEASGLEIYIPVFSVNHMKETLTQGKFLTTEQIEHYQMLINKMNETQELVAEVFDKNGLYLDQIRKHNPHVAPIIKSYTLEEDTV